jgi:hypothetical protein
MKYTSDFDLDLKEGKIKEEFVKHLLYKNGGIKVEVKYDKICCRTGNIAVEMQFMGKPSGIATTTADYWAFVLDKLDITVFIKTERLKKLVKKYSSTKITDGGDMNNSIVVKVPIKDIFNCDNWVDSIFLRKTENKEEKT